MAAALVPSDASDEAVALLDSYVVRASDDGVLELRCSAPACLEPILCDVEASDTLAELVAIAINHTCTLEPT